MEYDPTVSTHKASSITSTTSTSSSSTWDHPLSSNNNTNYLPMSFNYYNNNSKDIEIKNEETTGLQGDNNSLFTSFNDHLYFMNDYHERKDSANTEEAYNTVEPKSVTPIYLQHGDRITVPYTQHVSNNNNNTFSSTEDYHTKINMRQIRPQPNHHNSSHNHHVSRQRSNSTSSVTSNESKRLRINKDILTDDEKRVNHIASEQKRRNTIRVGFKELTDMIPTLKNINNSKSTILFKAVEYIKHLDKRNRGLREKVATLQVRMNVEGRYLKHHQAKVVASSPSQKLLNQQRQKRLINVNNHNHSNSNSNSNSSSNISSNNDQFRHLPAHTVTALLAHKNQQRQLEALQEQLRVQQQLLVKHNIVPHQQQTPLYPPSSSAIADTANLPNYNSISIPSSRSSNSDEGEHLLQNALVIPQDSNNSRRWYSEA